LIGTILRESHPKLTGQQIGSAIERIQQWMQNNKIENIPENVDKVTDWIKKQDFSVLSSQSYRIKTNKQSPNNPINSTNSSSNDKSE